MRIGSERPIRLRPDRAVDGTATGQSRAFLGDDPHLLGEIAGLCCGFLAGATVSTFTWWVARRSRVLLIVLVGAVCASAWVLSPRQTDVSESFVPRSNQRWACTGWSFRHYPPDTFDAAETTYCVGLEGRIADG